MSRSSPENAFSFSPLVMLFFPYAAIAYFYGSDEVMPAGIIAVGTITGLSLLLFVIRNWEELVAGMLGSLLLIAILAGCAFIPFVGWIADLLILLFALGSIWASIEALAPYAIKAAMIWAVFVVSLLPALYHPVASTVVVFLVCVGLGAALAKKARPFDEFILLMSSLPLLALAIASLGRLLQSGLVMRSAQFRQNVSGYTTRAGVQVGDYTRTITKTVPVSTTSINPAAAAIGSAAGQPTKDRSDD